MGFDQSRHTFDPWKDYCGVVMQQGRVQMDSDWNEWLAELGRRIQAGTLDTLGRAVYPQTTPSAFKISASGNAQGNSIRIGAGRMYVDGLLAENHGSTSAASWDPALEEISGSPIPSDPKAPGIAFSDQPYLPGASLPPGNGPFLVYLDVWRRPVSALQDRSLIDKAVGVDTTGRLQTVWQVKLLDVSKVAGINCDTDDAEIPDWLALIQPSAGRLTSGIVPSVSSGPCCLSPETGYSGMENQLYRVEIHQQGSTSATFKWSRENASVVTAVTGVDLVTNTLGKPASQLTVESLGRDQVLGFAPGQWIEITDDIQELNGLPGELHQIDSIDFGTCSITLDSTVDSTRFPVSNGATEADRHTRIRRWDQAGKVYASDGSTVWADLSVSGSTGDIPVPPDGTTLILEQGITVSFNLDSPSGTFHSGDYWTFAARSADGSVEPLVQAPPRGIHHHYARLSVVNFPTTASDCRISWPPAASADCRCCCSVVISPSDLKNGLGLQDIIDKYQNLETPTIVCLAPGTYRLREPLRFNRAHSNIRLHGSGNGSVVIEGVSDRSDTFADGLIVLLEVSNVELRGLDLRIPESKPAFTGSRFAGRPLDSLDPDVQSVLTHLRVRIGIRPVACSELVVEGCRFDLTVNQGQVLPNGPFPFGVGILATGECDGWRIEGNTFEGGGAGFSAGVLFSSSVLFNPPQKPTDRASTASSSKLPSTVRTSTLAGALRITRAQTLLLAGTSTPDLAVLGGRVLPAILDRADFTDNTFLNLTIALVSLGDLGSLDFSRNRVENCSAGVWLIAPSRTDRIVTDAQNLALIGLSIALGISMPTGTLTTGKSWVVIPPAPTTILVQTGKQSFTDSTGHLWVPDTSASNLEIRGGDRFTAENRELSITGALPSTSDQALYRSERFGTFTYLYKNLPRGFYSLTLKFAEIRLGTTQSPGDRVFGVSINQRPVLRNFDIVADIGASNTADDWRFDNIVPDRSGTIAVEFTGTSLGKFVDAKVSAVSLVPQWSSDFLATEALPQDQTGSTSVQEFPSFFLQLQQIAQQGFVDHSTTSRQIRLTDNEMRGLTASALLLFGDDEVQNPRASSLLMTGNRLVAQIPLQQDRRFQNSLGSLTASTNTSQKAVAPGLVASSVFFRCVVGISQVTLCTLSSNLILNEFSESSLKARTISQLSLMLYNVVIPSPAITTPPPGILVASNLFQGRIFIVPPRFPSDSSVPSPMNAWDFLNTVIP